MIQKQKNLIVICKLSVGKKIPLIDYHQKNLSYDNQNHTKYYTKHFWEKDDRCIQPNPNPS